MENRGNPETASFKAQEYGCLPCLTMLQVASFLEDKLVKQLENKGACATNSAALFNTHFTS